MPLCIPLYICVLSQGAHPDSVSQQIFLKLADRIVPLHTGRVQHTADDSGLRFRLCKQRLQMPGDSARYQLVPVWDFYGTRPVTATVSDAINWRNYFIRRGT